MWILSRSIVPAFESLPFPLLSMMSLKSSDMLDLVLLMLYKAKLRFISSLTLLSLIEISMLELEFFRFLRICSAFKQDLLRSGCLYDSSIF